MAKKSKTKAKAKQAVKPSEVLPQIGEQEFNRLVKRFDSLTREAASTNGTKGELVQIAVASKHLDRKAFSMFMSLRKMAGAKLATTLAAFDYYRDIGGLDAIATEQAELAVPRQEAGETTIEDAERGGRGRLRVVDSAQEAAIA